MKRTKEEKIRGYMEKIRKLERRRKFVFPLDSSSEDEGRDSPLETAKDDKGPTLTEQTMEDTCQNFDPILSEPEPAVPGNSSSDPVDPELLLALGESISDCPDFGPKTHENLSRLWLPILKKGTPKEEKENLMKEYLTPDNCRFLQAPSLNAEVAAAIPDMVRNRDKTLSLYQKQLGHGITAVNRGIDMLLRNDNKIDAVKHFSSGCRLLCDLHYMSTQNRIKLVTPSLDKSLLHLINNGERDDTLFGAKLSDKIKAAKAIEKQGLQIKKPPNPPKDPVSQSGPRSSFQGNWTAPLRYPANRGGGRGGYKKIQAPMMGSRRRTYNQQQQHRAATQDKPRAQVSTKQ